MANLAVICGLFIALCSAAHGYVVGFDDIPSGTALVNSDYATTYRLAFGPLFQAIDHTTSSWGTPHSDGNVLALGEGSPPPDARILFGHYTGTEAIPDDVQCSGSWFGTAPGAMVRVTAYRWVAPSTLIVVDSAVVGASGAAWDNIYVELGSTESPFNMLKFEGVNSTDDLLGFCLDDMSVTYVPEPSSLSFLSLSLAGAGVGRLRRRRAV